MAANPRSLRAINPANHERVSGRGSVAKPTWNLVFVVAFSVLAGIGAGSQLSDLPSDWREIGFGQGIALAFVITAAYLLAQTTWRFFKLLYLDFRGTVVPGQVMDTKTRVVRDPEDGDEEVFVTIHYEFPAVGGGKKKSRERIRFSEGMRRPLWGETVAILRTTYLSTIL